MFHTKTLRLDQTIVSELMGHLRPTDEISLLTKKHITPLILMKTR